MAGKSWHRIRDEMLVSHAWKAATHLQRSMVFALLTELGRHSGKNNGDLIFTNRDLEAFGFSVLRSSRTYPAIEALGLYAYKRGRPGPGATTCPTRAHDLHAHPRRRRQRDRAADRRMGTLPTTKEAKMAAKTAYKRAQGSNFRCNQTTGSQWCRNQTT